MEVLMATAMHTVLTVDVTALAETFEHLATREEERFAEATDECITWLYRGGVDALRVALNIIVELADPASNAHAAYVR